MNYYDNNKNNQNGSTSSYNGYRQVIRGTKERVNSTDYSQRCAACGRFFFFDHDSNRKVVVCPWFEHHH